MLNISEYSQTISKHLEDFSVLLRTSELLTDKSEHTVFVISTEQVLLLQVWTKLDMLDRAQKWFYPVVKALVQTNLLPTCCSFLHVLFMLAGQDLGLDQHFIYQFTYIQNEPSVL